MEGRGNGVDWEMLGGDPNRRRLEEDPATWVYSTYGVNSFTSTVHCAGPGFKQGRTRERNSQLQRLSAARMSLTVSAPT